MVATEPVHDPMEQVHEGAEVPEPPGLLPQSDDENVIDDITELRLLVKQLRLEIKTKKEKEDKHEKENNKDVNMNNQNVNMSNTYDDSGIQQSLRNFDAKSVQARPVERRRRGRVQNVEGTPCHVHELSRRQSMEEHLQVHQ